MPLSTVMIWISGGKGHAGFTGAEEEKGIGGARTGRILLVCWNLPQFISVRLIWIKLEDVVGPQTICSSSFFSQFVYISV